MSASQPTFRTHISRVAPGEISIRGGRIEDLIDTATFTDVVCLVIHGRRPSQTERVLVDAIFASAADHGFVGTPTAVTRYAASGSGSLPAAVAAGILGIGATTAVPHLIAELLRDLAGEDGPRAVPGEEHFDKQFVSDARGVRLNNSSTQVYVALKPDERIDELVRGYRSRHERLPGLGHPVHRPIDPRSEALRRVARRNGCYDGYVALADRLADRFTVVTGRELTLNVDALIGAILLEFGWTPEQIFGLTILALTPSLVAHGIEEIADGRPMRIIPTDQVEYPTDDEPGPRP